MKPRLLVTLLVVIVGVAPLLLPSFQITLLNYIGLYTLVVLGLVLLWIGRRDLGRPDAGVLMGSRPRRRRGGLS